MQLLGINEKNISSGNDTITAGRTLPWLQDAAEVDVWNSWQVTYRDVIILNDKNEIVDVYNLTVHDLKDSNNYAALKALLLEAAP